MCVYIYIYIYIFLDWAILGRYNVCNVNHGFRPLLPSHATLKCVASQKVSPFFFSNVKRHLQRKLQKPF